MNFCWEVSDNIFKDREIEFLGLFLRNGVKIMGFKLNSKIL